ncbi:hypothetical protein [Pseudoalteromonas sp. Q18-MNA-CIBAN-0097]|uniref:hypothetical protein n=1 Tax=Pseudoalteromonas sp. Q18-MNA-CIBAN-0097 TaxID=3140440 RepID=UPI00333468AA
MKSNNTGKLQYIKNKVFTYFQHDITSDDEAIAAIKLILIGLDSKLTVEYVCDQYLRFFGNHIPMNYNACHLSELLLDLTNGEQ